jgi:hypothetical protein
MCGYRQDIELKSLSRDRRPSCETINVSRLVNLSLELGGA